MKIIYTCLQYHISKYIFIGIVLLFSTSNLFAFEKTGITSFQFLSVRPSARAAALGGAFCTVVDNSEASFWNPAGLTKIQLSDFSISYTNYFLDVKMYSYSAAYNTQEWGTFGFFGTYSSVGAIEVTRVDYHLGFDANNTFNPGLTGETIKPFQVVFGLSYALSLTDRFAFGVNAKFVEENLFYAKSTAFIFDGGFNFETGYKSIQVGAAIKNFGQDVKYIEKKYPLPQTFSIGVSANLMGNNDNNLLVDSDIHKVMLAYEVLQPRDYDQQHILGIEYTYDKMIAFRAGYKFNGDQESISYGLGLVHSGIRFDYAYSAFGDYLPAVHRITLGFVIN